MVLTTEWTRAVELNPYPPIDDDDDDPVYFNGTQRRFLKFQASIRALTAVVVAIGIDSTLISSRRIRRREIKSSLAKWALQVEVAFMESQITT
jgi:hypothetical protein